MIHHARISLIAIAAFAAVHAPAALAQTARSGEGANAQLMQQLQQLGSERTALQTENARLKKELETLRKERDDLKSGQAALAQRARSSEAAVARSSAERENDARELEAQKIRMQELIAKFRETAESLRSVESERVAFQQSLLQRGDELKSCVERNTALYALNGEILDRMDGRGFWSGLAAAEPFTRVKRVQLENLADDYRQKAEDQRISSTAPSSR